MELIVAASFARRLRGLALRRSPPADRALVLPRCRSVHTIGMRFALDLVWLRGDEVVRVDRAVPPRRVRRCRAADSVVEVAAGRAGAVLAVLRRGRPPERTGESPAPTGPGPRWG